MKKWEIYIIISSSLCSRIISNLSNLVLLGTLCTTFNCKQSNNLEKNWHLWYDHVIVSKIVIIKFNKQKEVPGSFRESGKVSLITWRKHNRPPINMQYKQTSQGKFGKVPYIQKVSDGINHNMFWQMVNILHRLLEGWMGPELQNKFPS